MRQADQESYDDDDDEEESKYEGQSRAEDNRILSNNNQHENRIEMLLSEMRSEGGSVDLNPPAS
jgi:hypothetical protein